MCSSSPGRASYATCVSGTCHERVACTVIPQERSEGRDRLSFHSWLAVLGFSTTAERDDVGTARRGLVRGTRYRVRGTGYGRHAFTSTASFVRDRYGGVPRTRVPCTLYHVPTSAAPLGRRHPARASAGSPQRALLRDDNAENRDAQSRFAASLMRRSCMS